MADVAGITAVRVTEDTEVEKVAYGATIAPGDPLYLDTVDNEYKPAAANAAGTARVAGIAVTPGVDGGHGLIAIGGSIYLVGATLVVGAYVLSATAGKIAPEADLATGNYVAHLGYGIDANTLQLEIKYTGAQHA